MNVNLRGREQSRLLLLGLGLVLTAAWSGAADASVCSSDPNNIVADCGFDTEDASSGPVTSTNPTTWVFSGDAGIDETNPLSAPNDAFLGTGTITQTLSLVAGTTYSISFYLAADQTTINDAIDYDLNEDFDSDFGAQCAADPECFDPSVTVSFDGQTLDQIFADDGNFLTADAYVQFPEVYAGSFTYTPTASDSSGTLVFSGSQDPNAGNAGTWYLDEVQADPVSVPEPGDLGMFLTALAGWYSICRWRRIA